MVVQASKRYYFAEFSIDIGKRVLRRGEEQIRLTNLPFQVLVYLMENRDRIVTRAELLELFWQGKDVYDDTLTKCIGAIRKALDDRMESPRFIETRWAEGYRYIGPCAHEPERAAPGLIEFQKTDSLKIVIEEETVQCDTPGELQKVFPQTQAARATRSFSRRAATLVFVCAIIAMASVVLALYITRAGSGEIAISKTRSIVVLPLKNLTGDPAQEYFSDGITESLITELSRIDGLKVISRASAFTFKDKEVDPREIGKRLGVATVLEGSLRKSGDRVRVEIRLVDAGDGRVIWVSDTYDRPLEDIFAVQDDIGCGVAANMKAVLCGEERGQFAKRYTYNVEAYQAYLKGRYSFYRQYSEIGPVEALKRAREYFEKAIALDAGYALAYAGLAECHAQMVWYGPAEPKAAIARARAAALKALEIDDTLVEAHVALACAYCYERDFERAEQENKRAIAINPNYAPARHEYATYLVFMGRLDEAMAEIKRAEELDPLNLVIAGDHGQVLYYTGRHDESIEQFQKLIEMNAGCKAMLNIGMAYLEKGMHERAIDELQEDMKCRGRTFERIASLAYAYAVAGSKANARSLLNEMTEMSKTKYTPKLFFAYVYAGLGETEKAFEMLEKAYEEHDINLLMMKTHPWLGSLRSYPRFQDLLGRVGLPD